MVEAKRVDVVTTAHARTLILGGARSGKSRYAESLFDGQAAVRYLATGYPSGDDPDWTSRIVAHQQRRPPGWTTVETLDVVTSLRDATTPLLIDCVALWLTRLMDRHHVWTKGCATAEYRAEVDDFVTAWNDFRGTVVAVSNEVGQGVVPPSGSGRLFRDELGLLNQRLAAAAEGVWLLVAGLPVHVK